jgi:accessory gene regulator protein AgrB
MDLKHLNRKYDSPFVGKRSRVMRMFLFKERKFLRMLFFLFLITGALYPYPYLAMWIGFAFAGYSAIANDSIQTIGTFLSSNGDRKWWVLWLFLGGIFVTIMTVGWIVNSGDVSFGRLHSKGFDKSPESFRYLQVAAPLVLLFLTRLRMPVSTTFLLLSAFSASSSGILGVLTKSLSGYAIAFVCAIAVWFLMSKPIKRFIKGKYHPGWRVTQWAISGALWCIWLMQDAANIAVFLPRNLTLGQFIAFVSYIFFGLGLLLYFRGGRIQNIINEKSDVKEIKGATVIDFVYTLVLLFFYYLSNIPMSTTWVFLGLLAGRELAMKLAPAYKNKRSLKKIFKLIRKDAGNAIIGLVISIILAILVNPLIQQEILEAVGLAAK